MPHKRKVLAVDIGNSRICCGLFSGEKLIESWNYSSSEALVAASHLSSMEEKLSDSLIVVSSVVPDTSRSLLGRWPSRRENLFEVSSRSQTLLKGLYDSMGADRIANAAAAFKLYTKDAEAAIVIDFGTATTLTAVNNKGNFLGGMITLGLSKTFQALHHATAQLPELAFHEGENPSSPLSFDTQRAIERGCVTGHIGLVRYWVEKAKLSLPSQTAVIATGGLAPLIAPAAEIFNYIDVNLTLKGIRLIGEAAMAPADPG